MDLGITIDHIHFKHEDATIEGKETNFPGSEMSPDGRDPNDPNSVYEFLGNYYQGYHPWTKYSAFRVTESSHTIHSLSCDKSF